MRGTKVGVRLFGFVEYAISLLPNISKATLTIGKEKPILNAAFKIGCIIHLAERKKFLHADTEMPLLVCPGINSRATATPWSYTESTAR